MLDSYDRPIRKSTRLSQKEEQLLYLLMGEAGTSNESAYWRKLLYAEARRSQTGQQFLAGQRCSPTAD